MNLTQLQQIVVLIYISYAQTLFMIWNKFTNIFGRPDKTKKLNLPNKVPSTSLSEGAKRSLDLSSSSESVKVPPRNDAVRAGNMLDRSNQLAMRLAALEDDTLDNDSSDFTGTGTTAWFSKPRDPSFLREIIVATECGAPEEESYAFSEMLKMLDRLDPSDEEHQVLLEEAFSTVIKWTNRTTSLRVDREGPPELDQLPFLLETARLVPRLNKFVESLGDYLVRCMDSNEGLRRQAVYTVGILLERKQLPEDVLRDHIVHRLYDYITAREERDNPEHRSELTTVLCRIIHHNGISDRHWLFQNFVWRYSHLLSDSVIHVRKAAASILGHLAKLFGQRFTELFVVPHILYLSEDPNWGIRKSICDIFVDVSVSASRHVRRTLLAPRYIKMLHDPSRWVCYAAYGELGRFISTFSDSDVTGLGIRDGQVFEKGSRLSESSCSSDVASEFSFDRLPDNVWLPSDSDDSDGMEVMDETDSFAKLSCYYKTATSSGGQLSGTSSSLTLVSSSVQSSSTVVDDTGAASAAAKCSSYENLSDLGLDDHEDMGMLDSDEDEDSDSSDGLNMTMIEQEEGEDKDDREEMEQDQPLINETDDDTTMSCDSPSGSGAAASSADDVVEETEMAADDDVTATTTTKKCNGETTGDTASVPDELFSPNNYWSNDFNAFTFEEELIEFGSSYQSPCMSAYMAQRLDVLLPVVTSPQKTCSSRPSSRTNVLLSSPGRSPSRKSCTSDDGTSVASEPDSGVSCSNDPETNTPEPMELAVSQKEEQGGEGQDGEEDSLLPWPGAAMDDEDERRMAEQAADKQKKLVEEEETEDEQKLVPQDLVDMYMGMVNQGAAGNNETDTYMQCAHSFPAVAYTLGREQWPLLRDTYTRLAYDDLWRVRMSIAASLHTMAAIVGPRHADDDLVPVFNVFRDDITEVRSAVLNHLSDFVKCLTPEKRRTMIDVLPQFMPQEQIKWRLRSDLVKQCREMCDLYGVDEINRTMTAIALTLADDRAAEVRKEAVKLVSLIMGRLVAHECPPDWHPGETDDSFDMSPSATPLTDLFIMDLVGFARSLNWKRRQTFAFICEQIMSDRSMANQQFSFFLLPHLAAMASDRVNNVRIAVCRALARLPPSLHPVPLGSETTQPVSDVLTKLLADVDMDVARQARNAAGCPDGRELINVEGREERLKDREDQMMLARLNIHDTTNYESVDMDISDPSGTSSSDA